MEWKTGYPEKDGIYYVRFKTDVFADAFNIKTYYDIMTVPYTTKKGWCSYGEDYSDQGSWRNVVGYAPVEEVEA